MMQLCTENKESEAQKTATKKQRTGPGGIIPAATAQIEQADRPAQKRKRNALGGPLGTELPGRLVDTDTAMDQEFRIWPSEENACTIPKKKKSPKKTISIRKNKSAFASKNTRKQKLSSWPFPLTLTETKAAKDTLVAVGAVYPNKNTLLSRAMSWHEGQSRRFLTLHSRPRRVHLRCIHGNCAFILAAKTFKRKSESPPFRMFPIFNLLSHACLRMHNRIMS